MKTVKLNNSGFMLVEVIIVTVVVATIMTSLYVAFNKVYNNYELKESYINVDAIYGLKTVEDLLVDEIKLDNLLDNLAGNKEIKCSDMTDVNYCNNVFTQYKFNKVFLIKKINSTTLSSLPSDVNQTFKDYITYLNNAIVNSSTSTYILVAETKTISTDSQILNRYAYLEIK